MKLFERHGGYWLFWSSAIYLAVGLYCSIYYKDIPTAAIQLPWLFVMAGPLLFPPLGRWLNLDIEWDRKFMKWFNKKEVPQYVPEGMMKPSETKDEVPASKESQKKATGHTMYSIGLTDENRVSFRMGYNEITMNPQGVQNMIDQLELFKQQIMDVNPAESTQ